MKSLEDQIAEERAAWGSPPEPAIDEAGPLCSRAGSPEIAEELEAEVPDMSNASHEGDRPADEAPDERVHPDAAFLTEEAKCQDTDPNFSMAKEVELGERATAFIRIQPDTDPAYFALRAELVVIQRYAENAVIATQDDAKLVTNDLVLMAKLGKSIEGLRKEYTVPVRTFLDGFNASFKELTDPLIAAEALTKKKLLVYNAKRQEEYRIAEAERQIAEAETEAKRLQALHATGEVIESPIEDHLHARVQEPQKSIRAEMGTASQADCWKWKVKDKSLIPMAYYTLDEAKVTRLVKAGERNIPGIEIYNEPYIATRG